MPAIADSPTAQALFEDARAQSGPNPLEAARIARRLLDEYRLRVVQVGPEQDGSFASVADEVERLLRASPEVLARFRDLESRAAERMLSEEGPATTAARRRLTPAGLRATLALAESAILRDRPEAALAALARIEGHPDLAGREALAAAALEAMSARRLGLSEREAAARSSLAAFGAQGADLSAEAKVATAAIDATARRTAVAAAYSPFAGGARGAAPEASWREIWSLDLDETLFRRLFGGAVASISPRVVERARNDAQWLAATPAVRDGRIYIHEGERVRCVDADSRDVIWTRDIGFGGVERDVGGVGDLSAMALEGDSLVFFQGHAFSNARTGSGKVWCVDAADGATRWSVTLSGLDGNAELEGLFPAGAPVIVDDTVVVLARKPTQRLEQVDWLVALDRATGGLRWSTSLAGAPGTRAIAGRRHGGVVLDGAAVVASTPLGVVARVRIDDGAVEWLRRFPVPLRDPRFAAEPWEAFMPVVADGRVLVVSPDEQEVMSLDRSSGRLLETRPIGPGTPWGSPRYLVQAELDDGTGIVLGIGNDVVAFRAADLSTRLWSFVEGNPARDLAKPGRDNRAGMRGRVSVSGESVLVPTLDELVVLSLETGAVTASIAGQRPGNGVILADRIVMAGDESLRVLMPPDRAERILRARLGSSPDDPGAAIALFELALATGRLELALDSARSAAAAFAKGRGDAASRELTLTRLIELAATHPEEGDAAFAVAAQFAAEPGLRVRMELSRGDFLIAAGRSPEATACWRALASDRALAWHLVDRDGVRRAARTEALRRIARLARRDADIDALIEREAAAALAAAATDGARAAVAWNWPRTSAAADAAVALAAAGRGAAEAVLLEAALPPAREDLVDRVRSAIVAADPASAPALERRIAELLVASGIDRPALRATPAPLPRLGAEPTEGIDIPGRLVRMTAAAAEARDPALAFISSEGSLARLSPDDLSKSWRHRLDDRDPTILWARDRLVVWQGQQGGDTALVLDPASGTLVFSTGKAATIWDGAAATPPAASQFAPDGAVFSPTRITPHCDGESLVLVRANGDLARFSVADAAAAPVLQRGALGQVYASALADGLLAVAGRDLGGKEPRPVVRVYDARTLELRSSLETSSGSDVRWVLPTRAGEVLLGTIEGIERWCPSADGAPRASLVTSTSDFSDSRTPMRVGASLVALDRSDRVGVVPLFEGAAAVLDLPGLPPSRIRTVRSLQLLSEGLLVHADDRLFLLSHACEVTGIDSTSRERNYQFALPTARGVLQVDGLGGRQVPGRDARTVQVEFPYVVEVLSAEHGLRIEGQAFEVRCRGQRVDRMQVMDGWVLFSSTMGMSAVRLPNPR